MIDKPIYRQLQAAVGDADGQLAIAIVLDELTSIFEMFAEEIEWLYEEDPENDNMSAGYRLAASWCQCWSEEVKNV
jgi:hypothetical protein